MQNAVRTAEKNRVEGGVLYLVATPIGNLSDLSERAKKVLSAVDFIAAEDTRNAGKLLTLFGIKKPYVSYFEHNKRERGAEILARLLDGASCALVTDAGMPAISDPGEDLVRLCAENGVRVTVIPGACAAVSALALSGLPTGRFAFEGFLPRQKGERQARLAAIENEDRTLILYEAPHHLVGTLSELLSALGDRGIALCRELTKLNEEILRMRLSDAVAYYEKEAPRGEYVLVIEGNTAPKQADSEKAPLIAGTPRAHIDYYMAQGHSRMDAIKAAAKDRGVPKSVLYAEVTSEK